MAVVDRAVLVDSVMGDKAADMMALLMSLLWE